MILQKKAPLSQNSNSPDHSGAFENIFQLDDYLKYYQANKVIIMIKRPLANLSGRDFSSKNDSNSVIYVLYRILFQQNWGI